MSEKVTFKVGDVVASIISPNGEMELGLITRFPDSERVSVHWTDGKNLIHSNTETAMYRKFYLQKVMVA